MPKFHLYTQLLGRFRKDGNPWIWQEIIILEHLTDQMNYTYYCLNPDEYTLGERELYKIAHGNKVADKKEAQMMGDGAFDVDDRDEFVVPYGFSLLALLSQTALLSDKYGFIHLVLHGKSAQWLTVKLVIDDKLARSVTQLLGYPLLLDHVRAGPPHPMAKAPPPGCFLEGPIRRLHSGRDHEREASLVKDAPWAPAKKTAGPPHPMAPPVGSPPKAPPPGCFLEGPIRRPLEAPAHAASVAASTAPLLMMPDEPWV